VAVTYITEIVMLVTVNPERLCNLLRKVRERCWWSHLCREYTPLQGIGCEVSGTTAHLTIPRKRRASDHGVQGCRV